MLLKQYFENINDWLENECLNILQENNYVLIKENINNNIVEAEFKNIFEIIEYPLNVPKINNKYIYDKINIISESYSYSGHLIVLIIYLMINLILLELIFYIILLNYILKI